VIGAVFVASAVLLAPMQATPIFLGTPDVVLPVVDASAIIEAGKSQGAGFAVGPDLVLTADHVVEGVTDVKVRFNEGKSQPGRVISRDSQRDIALVSTSTTDINPVPFANSLPRQESQVFTVGAATRALTVARGKYSGLVVQGGQEFLEVDVPISPGNSGGPLVNAEGSVIGMIVQRDKPTGETGYAVPLSALTAFVNGQPDPSPTPVTDKGTESSSTVSGRLLTLGALIVAFVVALIVGVLLLIQRIARKRRRIVISMDDIMMETGNEEAWKSN
jgi:S1-C subfamily serine protease